jgi:hypothetical protein
MACRSAAGASTSVSEPVFRRKAVRIIAKARRYARPTRRSRRSSLAAHSVACQVSNGTLDEKGCLWLSILVAKTEWGGLGMKQLLLVVAFSMVATAASAQSCTTIDKSTFCNNGISGIRSGNTTFWSDGTSSVRSSDSAFNSDGISVIHSGNSTFYSDGSSSIRSGNSTFFSDGRSCIRSGNSILCN